MDSEKDPPSSEGSGAASIPAAKAKEEFSKKLRRHFEQLVARGMAANDAAATALKLASGVAEPPLDVEAFAELVASAKASRAYHELNKQVKTIFSSVEGLGASFLLAPGAMSHAQLCIDFVVVKRVFNMLTALEDDGVDQTLMSACDALLGSLIAAADGAGGWPETGGAVLRQMLIVMEIPLLMDPNYHETLIKLMRVITAQPDAAKATLSEMFRRYTREQMVHAVAVVQQFITIHLYESHQVDAPIETAAQLLAMLHAANQESGQLSHSDFYNDAVNNEDFNLKEDYWRWKQPEKFAFSFCQFPFMYDPSAKGRILQLESTNKMSHEVEDAMLRSIFIGNTSPYLVLKVRREHLVTDTLVQVQRAISCNDLKKPLKVHFVGEDGVDEGGVQKEFFQLLVRQIFDPSYCMFVCDEDTRLYWFKASPLELDTEFELVGILIGLAIYNSHILDFRFPMATYSKLLGRPLGVDDLEGVAPSVHRSFNKLLEFEGDVASHFALNFQVSYEVLGEVCTMDLVEGGASVPVTSANRQDYVDRYTAFLLEGSIASQFKAFHRGFSRLCSGPVLNLFCPEELEQLICGSPILDFEALQHSTQYGDGYTKDSQVIGWFWQVVHSLSEEHKKRLLFFATGSDRVPIKGLGNLPFVISRNGSHSDQLPSAHTCFNHLLLPEYNSEEDLRRRLMTAIENAEGFGLM